MGTNVRKFARQSILDRQELPLEEIEITPGADKSEAQAIDVDQISPSPYQPRTKFSEAGIRALADSIASLGLINPVAVRTRNGAYELITGERRLRAVKSLGHSTIKATVHDVDDMTAAIMAFDENFRRKNLSEYENYRWVTIMLDEFKLKQADIAQKLSLTAGRLSQIMAVGKLPDDVIKRITPMRFVTEHHIRALRRLQRLDGRLMYNLLDQMEKKPMNRVEIDESYQRLVAQSQTIRTPVDGVLEEIRKRVGDIKRNPGRFSGPELRQTRAQLIKIREIVNQYLAADLGIVPE